MGAMIENEVRKWLNKNVCIHWTEADGSLGGMQGTIIRVKDNWLVVDWGYGADVGHVTRIHDQPEECKEL